MNRLYDHVGELLLAGDVPWRRRSFLRLALLDTAAYTFNGSHTLLAQVPSAALLGTPYALTGVIAERKDASCNDVRFVGISAARPASGLLLYADAGTRDTSALIAHFDDVPGLPVVLDGHDVVVGFPAHHVFHV